ncbi:MAG: mechanosensitive ion channel family protein [Anaerolineae bacterium]|nr:mechanosensitive ion channel family protein [Anaerolineae bacterium]
MIEQVVAGLSVAGQLILVKLLQVGLTAILALVALRIAQVAADRFERQIDRSDDDPARRARLQTLVSAGLNTARAIIVLLAALMILGELGVDLTPILASVGVVTLAVSLGAQTIIKDFIGGLLVLIENQYRVGDTVQIGTVTGKVEQITLRATYVREASGRLSLVPNGEVRVVANASQGWALVTIDLSFPLDADIEKARHVLQASLEQANTDPALSPCLLEPPQVASWHGLSERAVQLALPPGTASGGVLARPQRAGGAGSADRQDDAR